MKPFWRRRARYQAVIVGLESGHRSALPFVTFTDAAAAWHWCERMNRMADATAARQPLTVFEYEEIA